MLKFRTIRLVAKALLLCCVALVTNITQAGETIDQRAIISIERIWDRPQHAAFTDLIRFGDSLYCTFREGSGHIPGLNGVVRVIRSEDGMNWRSVALIAEEHVDLRDPKLSITPDGRLMINTGASYYHGSDRQRIESRAIFSDADGETFGRPQKIKLAGDAESGFDWLWRVTWHDGWAWGCVQQVPNQGERSLHLVRSRDGINYEYVTKLDVPSPTETTLRFKQDGTMLAMTRRTGSDPVGWIGHAKSPYKRWEFQPSNQRFGGPNFVQLPDSSWLAGSREYGKSTTTGVWKLDPSSAQFTHVVTLPSRGDNSYPGFVVDEDQGHVLMSYYSSHEGKTAIYLATLRLSALSPAQGAK